MPPSGARSETSTFFTTLAGLPTTTVYAGTSFVTTLPAPTVAPRPMDTPGSMTTFPPIQTSAPMDMGRPYSGPRVPSRRVGSVGWEAL